MILKDFSNFIGESNGTLSERAQKEWLAYNVDVDIEGTLIRPSCKLDSNGKFIVHYEEIAINSDYSEHCHKIPIKFSEKSNPELLIRFPQAKKLKTLQGFPPLPNASFVIEKFNAQNIHLKSNSSVNIPDDQFDLIFNNSTPSDGNFKTLSPIGLRWLSLDISWEEFKASHRGTIHGTKYSI